MINKQITWWAERFPQMSLFVPGTVQNPLLLGDNLSVCSHYACIHVTSSASLPPLDLNKNNLCGHSFSQDFPPNNISLML